MTEEEGAAIAVASAHAQNARTEIEQTERYLARGRSYRDTSNDDLTLLWIAGMRDYARTIHPRPQVVDDAGAELGLRGLDPPWDAVRAETARLRAVALASLEAMGEEDRDAFGVEMIDKYLEEKGRSQ